jgi:ATP-dependent helicase/DNAse subunit B
VGAFYVSLLRKYRAVDAPDEVQEEDGPDELVPRGVFDGARIELLESDMPETGRGRVFKIYRKQDGALGYMDAYDATTSAQFVALLAHTRQRLGSLADGVLDGDVTISPYRLKDFSPCHWCDMRSVCRFEFGDSGMRHLPAMKRSEVLERLEGA